MPQQMPLRSLLAEISALTLHVQQLSRMAGEASALIENSQMPAPLDPEPLRRDARRQQDDGRAALEEAIMGIFEDVFGPRTDTLERQMSMSLIAEIGPAAFVQKVLWGEEISDIALTIALERMLPALEQLVEAHPQAFLQQANAVLGRFKGN
ncbi:hypothetical protein [Herbaspirillum sp.]|uniref:hypothetical protein n=1 Tax=Herbaspirillum sp. TaxID=1890675 RepID=UPI0031D1D025